VAHDIDQMDKRLVARCVAQPVVDLLEIVDVEQGHAKGGILALHAGDLARQRLG
jgi:hypothetical protein